MGFLTVVVLRNDALDEFQRHPEEFGKTILDGVAQANGERMKVTITLKAISLKVQCLVRLCRVCRHFHSDEGYDKVCRKCWSKA